MTDRQDRAIDTCRDPKVTLVLDELHRNARGDIWRFAGILPKLIAGRLKGHKMLDTLTPAMAREVYMPVSREEGRFLYQIARLIGARNIVEFGTSFGISTIYLAAAIKDNGGGKVVGTEIEPSKHETATANLARAGLADCADVRLGDALETLRESPHSIDMIFLDGWKDLYLPVLELLKPRMRAGGVVLADNIHTFKTALRPFVDYLQSGENGFISTTLSISDGLEFSIRA